MSRRTQHSLTTSLSGLLLALSAVTTTAGAEPQESDHGASAEVEHADHAAEQPAQGARVDMDRADTDEASKSRRPSSPCAMPRKRRTGPCAAGG